MVRRFTIGERVQMIELKYSEICTLEKLIPKINEVVSYYRLTGNIGFYIDTGIINDMGPEYDWLDGGKLTCDIEDGTKFNYNIIDTLLGIANIGIDVICYDRYFEKVMIPNHVSVNIKSLRCGELHKKYRVFETDVCGLELYSCKIDTLTLDDCDRRIRFIDTYSGRTVIKHIYLNGNSEVEVIPIIDNCEVHVHSESLLCMNKSLVINGRVRSVEYSNGEWYLSDSDMNESYGRGYIRQFHMQSMSMFKDHNMRIIPIWK